MQAPAVEGEARLNWAKFPVEFADYYCIQGLPVEVRQPKPSFCRSDKPLFVDASHTVFITTLVLDESGGTDCGYDTLYVDFNRDGQHADDPRYKAERFDGELGPDKIPVVAYFADVVMPRRTAKTDRTRVQVFLEKYERRFDEQVVTRFNCTMIPQRWAVGTLTLGGRTMPMALVDTNWNDRVADRGGYTPGDTFDAVPKADYLILGIDGEKALRPPREAFVPGEGGSARGFLTKHLVLDSGTYELEAEHLAGGALLKVAPSRVPTGTIQLTDEPGASRVLLLGQSTCVMRSGQPTELVVPADTYLFMNVGYSRNVFTVEQGKQTVVNPRAERRGPIIVAPPPEGSFANGTAWPGGPAASQPAFAQPPFPAGGGPADGWTRYVQWFIATYKLDAVQQEQAWSILRDLQRRADEYRGAHKTDYEAIGKIGDKTERATNLQTLEKPITDMFEELKTRLMTIPTEAQRKAVEAGKPTPAVTQTQPARR